VSFWEDVWLEDKSFKEFYPNLYRTVRQKDDTVANVLATISLNVCFRQGLVNEKRNAWFDLVSKVVQLLLSNGKDVLRWNLINNGIFTIWSMYKTLIQQGVLPEKSPIWKFKIPLKIKTFLWYLKKG